MNPPSPAALAGRALAYDAMEDSPRTVQRKALFKAANAQRERPYGGQDMRKTESFMEMSPQTQRRKSLLASQKASKLVNQQQSQFQKYLFKAEVEDNKFMTQW